MFDDFSYVLCLLQTCVAEQVSFQSHQDAGTVEILDGGGRDKLRRSRRFSRLVVGEGRGSCGFRCRGMVEAAEEGEGGVNRKDEEEGALLCRVKRGGPYLLFLVGGCIWDFPWNIEYVR